jgi:hypothetical protein
MWATILAVAAGITCITVAVTHVIKVIHNVSEAAKRPWERVHERLDALEATDEKILEGLADLKERMQENDQVTARLELLNLMQHFPENNVAINRAYDKYTAQGYNSYIRDMVEEWREEQAHG